MSWVRPDWEILPQPSTHSVNAQLYAAVMVVVSQKLCRKCTIPADQWYVNPLCYPIAQSCFSRFLKGNISCLYIIPIKVPSGTVVVTHLFVKKILIKKT